LWGGPGFDRTNPFYEALKNIAAVRRQQPAIRYGRQYFRPVSGDGRVFGVSPFPGGIMAFSRILNDREIIIVANTSGTIELTIEVIIEGQLSREGDVYRILFSNQQRPKPSSPVLVRPAGSVEVHEVDGSFGAGPLNVLRVTLAPMEVQILGQ
jgi:hypothetical protein